MLFRFISGGNYESDGLIIRVRPLISRDLCDPLLKIYIPKLCPGDPARE